MHVRGSLSFFKSPLHPLARFYVTPTVNEINLLYLYSIILVYFNIQSIIDTRVILSAYVHCSSYYLLRQIYSALIIGPWSGLFRFSLSWDSDVNTD